MTRPKKREVRCRRLVARQSEPRTRVLIYGSGAVASTLLREIRSHSGMDGQVVGSVDDLPELIRTQRVDEILIAQPTVTGAQMTALLHISRELGLRCRTLPPPDDLVPGSQLLAQIRDIAVEDLLGRSPVRLEEDGIRQKLSGQVVMVTGAAGSIGSELCRQIARFAPKTIVALDVAETALFHLAREMKAASPNVDFAEVIGSVQSRDRLREVFLAQAPSIVYHAAAYKHVPMMEAHVVEAVENNVFGTWQIALAAAEHGVADVVMISSDKAVRPTSVMGATKRVAEMLMGAMQGGSTNFVSVRFGNVLGSSGSVVPLFQEQIAAGGPVTLTDPSMERYFMTVEEASQLVLQASTMGHGGEIFVLDMGDPIRIADLARNLILLAGRQPDRDVQIEISGIRPGEKLREELSAPEENMLPTRHPKIRIFRSPRAQEEMVPHLDALQHLCATRDVAGIVERLKQIVPEYEPSRFVRPDARSPLDIIEGKVCH